jgi:hypothetical protein
MAAGWNVRVTTFDSEGKPGIVRYFLAYEGVLSLQVRRVWYRIYGCTRSEHGSIRKERVKARGARSIAGILVADRYQARADAFILQPRFLRARYYLPFPDLRDTDANTLRTSDWEIPNCLAMRKGVIPALKVAITALSWPCVSATLGSSGCRRSGDSSEVVD